VSFNRAAFQAANGVEIMAEYRDDFWDGRRIKANADRICERRPMPPGR